MIEDEVAPITGNVIKTVNLALQGGGSHGAFTWGVLDRLLEDGRLAIEGVSGTSAGAMNAIVMADGYIKAGREGAREALDEFWYFIADQARHSPLQPTIFDRMRSDWNLDHSPPYMFLDLITRLMSPYQLNPLNINPLRDVLRDTIDFDALRRQNQLKLFVTATNVRSGKVRVFDNPELSIEVLLASACLPLLFQAIEIDGEHYWDGGYMGNPALFPLIYQCECRDLMIVQVNPLTRNELPTNARDILNRINEISFNSTLMRELRAIATVSKFLSEGSLDPDRYKDILVHTVEAEAEMRVHGASSKMNTQPDFLMHLRGLGRVAAEKWMTENFDMVGKRSTVDVFERFL